MPLLVKSTIVNFLKLRDELTIRNIRREILPLILVFPLSVIVGDLRYFDLKIEMWGFQSYELMLYPLGLGWLVLLFIPQKLILSLLRITAVCSIILLPFQFLLTDDTGRLLVFMAFQFINGICAACAFFLFCFRLNNVERLFGMLLILFYYGFYYTIWRTFPIVQTIGKTYGGAIAAALYVVIVFLCCNLYQGNEQNGQENQIDNIKNDKASGMKFIIALHMVYYTIMCTINYLEWMEKSVSYTPFGFGQFAAILFILIVQVRVSQSALYIWLMYLVLSLLGLGILIYDSGVTRLFGSFVYGLGDGLGYIIIYYLCAGAIQKSKSIKMYRLFCFILFIEYCLISGLYSHIMNLWEGPNNYLAFGVVLVLCSVCFMLIPLMQKKLYKADWTDGIQLQKIPEYAKPIAETKAVNIKDDLKLTDREQEIFTLLMKGVSPKEIGYILKVSYDTVGFHRKNLYRKLDIQSIHELFTKYGSAISEK